LRSSSHASKTITIKIPTPSMLFMDAESNDNKADQGGYAHATTLVVL